MEDNDELLDRFKAGDKVAANELISEYFDRVVRAAEKRLEGYRMPATSGEDVAASVFESLWKRADSGQFGDEDLRDCAELWRLLSTIIRFKAQNHVRYAKANKRGGDGLRGESVFIRPDGGGGIDEFAVDFSSVSQAVGFRDEFEHLLSSLDDPILSEIATMRLENHSVVDIGEHFGRSSRWVKRKLALIRDCWHGRIS